VCFRELDANPQDDQQDNNSTETPIVNTDANEPDANPQDDQQDNNSTETPIVNTDANEPDLNNVSPSSNNGTNCSAYVERRAIWENGTDFVLHFENNGDAKACGIKFELTLDPSVSKKFYFILRKCYIFLYIL
jgi:hypothetical protein